MGWREILLLLSFAGEPPPFDRPRTTVRCCPLPGSAEMLSSSEPTVSPKCLSRRFNRDDVVALAIVYTPSPGPRIRPSVSHSPTPYATPYPPGLYPILIEFPLPPFPRMRTRPRPPPTAPTPVLPQVADRPPPTAATACPHDLYRLSARPARR